MMDELPIGDSVPALAVLSRDLVRDLNAAVVSESTEPVVIAHRRPASYVGAADDSARQVDPANRVRTALLREVPVGRLADRADGGRGDPGGPLAQRVEDVQSRALLALEDFEITELQRATEPGRLAVWPGPQLGLGVILNPVRLEGLLRRRGDGRGGPGQQADDQREGGERRESISSARQDQRGEHASSCGRNGQLSARTRWGGASQIRLYVDRAAEFVDLPTSSCTATVRERPAP